MACNNCGNANSSGSNFCSKCGVPLRPVDPHTTALFSIGEYDTVEHEVLEERLGIDSPACLLFKRGPNAGSKYVLSEGEVLIGRHPESDLFLDDVTVSRRHARVIRDAVGVCVKDDGSLNGTYVNGERVEEALLRSYDELRIGKYVIVFLEE